MAGLLAGVVFLPAVYYSRPYVVGLWIVRVICLGGLAGLFYVLITVFYSGRDSNEVRTSLMFPFLRGSTKSYDDLIDLFVVQIPCLFTHFKHVRRLLLFMIIFLYTLRFPTTFRLPLLFMYNKRHTICLLA